QRDPDVRPSRASLTFRSRSDGLSVLRMVTPVVTLAYHWWDSPVMCGTLRRMETQTVRVGKKGRVVIPAGLREEAGISEGTELVAMMEGEGRIVLETRASIKHRLQAAGARAKAGRAGSAVDRLMAERREDARVEAR